MRYSEKVLVSVGEGLLRSRLSVAVGLGNALGGGGFGRRHEATRLLPGRVASHEEGVALGGGAAARITF